MRQTKIIATVGPATNSADQLRALIDAGVDVIRLNFSHGSHQSHGEVISRVRAASQEAGRHVAILQDLSGPKIRTGSIRGGGPLRLDPGDALRIAVGEFQGEAGRVSTTFAELPHAVHPGDLLLLDDGRLQLRVEGSAGGEIQTVVVDGGLLGEHKGINMPGVAIRTSGLTPKDVDDLRFGVSQGVDFVALSFVQRASDLLQARDVMAAAGASIPLVAKLERPEAIANLDEVLRACDAVMVARGDLGLEVPLERVPRLQKEVTRRARGAGIPVIVATQVLESMRTEPRPTRAEVSDAANAVDDRVDAIMLAGETAVGAYPIRAVRTLDAVIRDAESMPAAAPVALSDMQVLPGHGHALCEAALTLAERGGASAIIAVTRRGKTARVLSALRPRAPILAATESADVARRLTLQWGVMPEVVDLSGDITEATQRIVDRLVVRGAIASGGLVVLVSVTPDLVQGPSNFLKLQRA